MNKCTQLALLSSFCWLSLTPVYAQETQAQKEDLRLMLQRVTLFAETNKLDEAFALINQLKAQYPNNPQILQAEAELNLRIGNRGAGFSALNKALDLDPKNEDILERQRTAIIPSGPFSSLGYNFRRTGVANEHFTRFASQAMVSQSLSAGITVENDHINTKQPIQDVNGVSREFSENRQRGALMLSKTYDAGDEARALLYAANKTIGVGGQYSRWDSRGATTLQANIHRPDWDYVESVIGYGSKDNIRLERKQILGSNLQATLGGGFSNYNLDDETSVAHAGTWDLNIAYTRPYSFTNKVEPDVIFGAYYTVDAEYFTKIENRPNPSGGTFKPLPASSYEIHSVNLSASKNLSSQVHFEGFGGYALDRLGDDGILFGASLEYVPIERLGIELRGSRTMLGGQRNSEHEDQLGLNLKWRW